MTGHAVNQAMLQGSLMVQGCTSDAGKSILVTALGRLFARHGISVAPFKSQNMALNSAVTSEGGEIGRAQAVQAEACYLAPSVDMNPVLLKPNSDVGAQVIVHGHSIGNMNAQQYHVYKPELLQEVVASFQRLKNKHSVVLIEGAGSPAEINLREYDIANMGFAEAVDCPVIIVADIDRGGVFAHLFGTYELLSDTEKKRVKGFVINRFRGDIKLLISGLDWLEQKTGVPVLGVIPYLMDLHIESEDSIHSHQPDDENESRPKLKIVVPVLPRMSNHTDFDVLRLHPQVDCRFIRDVREYDGADLIILPGSKNVRDDLHSLRTVGWESVIQRHLRYGGKVMGICGGYQMLGDVIHDPHGMESEAGSSAGLGLLRMDTTLTNTKRLTQMQGFLIDGRYAVEGYEIHTGVSSGEALSSPLFHLSEMNSSHAFDEGARNQDDSVWGTYLHGLFDQIEVLNHILKWAGLHQAGSNPGFDYAAFKDAQFDRLADAVENAIPFEKLAALIQQGAG